MYLTLTVRGTLEEDATLQQIVSLLYGKTAPTDAPPALAATSVKPKSEETAPTTPDPVVAEAKPKKAKPATVNPEFEAAVQDMVDGASEPAPREEVSFDDIARAASKKLNEGKRDGFAALMAARGVKTVPEVPKEDYPAFLAEIEAL